MAERPDPLGQLRIDRSESERRGSRAPRFVLLAVAVAAVAAAGVWLWLRGSAAPVVRVVEARPLAPGDAGPQAVLDASGYVTARRQATVSSKITAKIVEVRIEEGQSVRAGDLLARLDDTLPRRQLALAEAQLASARSALAEIEVRIAEAGLALRRQRELLTAGVSSQAAVDTAQAELDSLTARLAVASDEVRVSERQLELRRQEVEDTLIRAPFDGVAISKDAQPGEMISPVSAGGGFTRTGVCTLVDMASLEIEVDVNEAYISRVHAGQRVTATLDAYPEWKIPASVITAVPAADRQKATVRVRIAFDEVGDPRILPDMGVKVSFLEEEAPPAETAQRSGVAVPRAALRREAGAEVVFVLRDERVERRAVRSGALLGEEIEILAGLRSGETVVVDGAEGLTDGSRVQVR